MRNPSKSAVYVVATGSLAMLLATSAFAEDRHHDETRHNQGEGQTHSWNRGDSNRNFHQDHQQQGAEPRTFDRGQSRSFDQNQSRNFDRGQARSFDQNQARAWDRGNTRNYGYDRSYTRNDSRASNWRGNDVRGSVRGDFRGSRESYRNGIPRSDGRVSMLGRVSRYEHDRGGYRIWVGGSFYPYWVPESYFFRHRIGIGLDLRLGGIFRDGSVYVDYLGWPGDPYYNDPYYYDAGYSNGYANGYSASVGTYDGAYAGATNEGLVSGTVDSVDYRAGTLYLRGDSSRRVITVDMRRVDGRNSRVDFGDLHPGDRVSLRGAWVDGNVFAAALIDGVNAY